MVQKPTKEQEFSERLVRLKTDVLFAEAILKDLDFCRDEMNRFDRRNEVMRKLMLDHFIQEADLLPGEEKRDRLNYLINLAEGEILR